MSTVTVVRSCVGRELHLPDGVRVRPWHFVELSEDHLSDGMRAELRELATMRHVQLSQIVDGVPAPTLKV